MTPQPGQTGGAGEPGDARRPSGGGAPGAGVPGDTYGGSDAGLFVPGAGSGGATADPAAAQGRAGDVVDEAVEVVEHEVAEVLGTLRRERDEFLDMLRRVQADFENYKKRTLRQQSDQSDRAAENLVAKILPVLDAFDLARAHLGGGDDAGAEGKALLTASGLLSDTLAKEGLERIDDPGAPFDPTMHEAVDRVEEAPGAADHDGPVVDGVLRAGYRWKGRVIRPAMVRVRADRRWWRNASGWRRTTTRSWVWPRRPRTRRSRAPTESWPSSSIPTPTRGPRTASRRSALPTTSSVTRPSAPSTTRCGASGASGFGGVGGGFGGPGGQTFRVEDLGDLGDLLGGLGANFGGGRRGRNAGPRRGADVEAELHLSFEDAVRGVTTTVHVAGEARCETCGGNGAAPGSTPVTCPTCHGRGALDDNQGLFSLSRVCPQCSGRGTVTEKPCPTCRGSGVTRRTREVKVRVPAGVEDGQRIRVKGRGAAGPGQRTLGRSVRDGARGRPPAVRPAGAQPDAGCARDVSRGRPGIDGDRAHARQRRHPARPTGHVVGTDVPCEGPGVAGHGRTSAGDLLVTVEVAVPKKLTDAQRAAVEEYARASDEDPRQYLEVNSDDTSDARRS